MTGQAGYTLVEMLAALAILGLAMTGVAESAHALKVIQDGASVDLRRDAGLAEAHRALDRLLSGQGPFRSDDAPGLVGTPRQISFGCGASQPCTGELTVAGDLIRLQVRDRRGWTGQVALPGLRNARFLYGDQDGPGRVWPPAAEGRKILSDVVLATDLAEGTSPVVVESLWLQQRSRCAYDPIIEDYREPVR